MASFEWIRDIREHLKDAVDDHTALPPQGRTRGRTTTSWPAECASRRWTSRATRRWPTRNWAGGRSRGRSRRGPSTWPTRATAGRRTSAPTSPVWRADRWATRTAWCSSTVTGAPTVRSAPNTRSTAGPTPPRCTSFQCPSRSVSVSHF